MRIFLTGATGFIGSAIVPELINAGHQVLGLSRSDAGANQLQQAGAEVHRGNIEDLASLRRGAENADAVIHCAFIHDFSQFMKNCEIDLHAIEAMGEVLKGSKRPLVITSGTALGNPASGEVATEDTFNTNHQNPRIASELAGAKLTEQGGNVIVVRLPQVHDPYKAGLISYLIPIAREKGMVVYLGEGKNRWPAAHRLDVARLYRLAVEKGTPGARYNAVAEEGISMREIAESLGRGMKLPVVSKPMEEAAEHYGWMAMFAGYDMPASSALTQERLGWKPTGPGLISDLDQAKY